MANIVTDTTVFGTIKNAIMNAEATATSLKIIEVSPTEMQELLAQPGAKTAADLHYASGLNEWMAHNAGKNKTYDIGGNDVDLPSSIWIKYVQILVVE